MIFRRFLYIVLALHSSILLSQELRTIKIKNIQISNNLYLSEEIAVPIVDENPFISLSIALTGDGIGQSVSKVFYKNIEDKWEEIKTDGHVQPANRWTAMSFLSADIKKTQLKIIFNTNQVVDGLSVNFYFPNHTDTLKNNTTNNSTSDVCGCPQPDLISRSTWCPNNNCPPNTNPSATDVNFLIVHHTAGSNSSSDWAAVVRSIWNFHVNTNGWADIGYNFLVDKEGKIYAGRQDDTRGAHFSGHNSGTSGMALMGNFTTQTPENQMLIALESLLVWKACNKDLDPLATGFHSSSGLTLNTISGHRDGGSTECPGDQMYPMLGDIRTNVNTQLNNCKLGVDEFALDRFDIYPNPTDSNLQIAPKFYDDYDLEIYNMLGQRIYFRKKINGNININLSPFNAGLYWLRLKVALKSYQFKLIKE